MFWLTEEQISKIKPLLPSKPYNEPRSDDRNGFSGIITCLQRGCLIEQHFGPSCNGPLPKNYIDWLAIAYTITLISQPALSLPCGCTRAGLPACRLAGGRATTGRSWGEHALLMSVLVIEGALWRGLHPIKPQPWITTIEEISA